MEKEQFLNQKTELNETLQKALKKKEDLLKEIEKLKYENISLKKNINNSFVSQGGNIQPNLEFSNINQNQNKNNNFFSSMSFLDDKDDKF